jgi:hypothetical protein
MRRHIDDPDGLAVAQDRGAMAERLDLQKSVRDEDDRAAGFRLPAHHVDDPVGEIGGQGRGHLVEQEDVGLERQRAGKIEHTLHRQRQAARARV